MNRVAYGVASDLASEENRRHSGDRVDCPAREAGDERDQASQQHDHASADERPDGPECDAGIEDSAARRGRVVVCEERFRVLKPMALMHGGVELAAERDRVRVVLLSVNEIFVADVQPPLVRPGQPVRAAAPHDVPPPRLVDLLRVDQARFRGGPARTSNSIEEIAQRRDGEHETGDYNQGPNGERRSKASGRTSHRLTLRRGKREVALQLGTVARGLPLFAAFQSDVAQRRDLAASDQIAHLHVIDGAITAEDSVADLRDGLDDGRILRGIGSDRIPEPLQTTIESL